MSPLVHWEHRVYEGDLRELSLVRTDITTDLTGFAPDVVDTLRLCLSELFANAVKYTDSGTEHGEIIRTLCLPGPSTLRLSVSDSGGGHGVPRTPSERDDDAWSRAEGQRGLFLVQSLSRAWGHYQLGPWAGLGTNVWAEFHVAPARVPRGLPPFVFTH